MSSASAPRVLGEALYILNGNVGIGTITPRSIFDIKSTLPVLIDSVAGIGIGTTTPVVSLEIHRKDSILLPKGTTNERPTNGVAGYIRYNTSTTTFEGYGAGNAWGSLGGVKDTNQDTYISAELYPGSNDDALRFVRCNVQRMTIDSYGNVGIGTSTMGSLVNIYGSSTAPTLTINQQGTGRILDVQDGGVSALTVIDGGNVGIGTTRPTNKLHVAGGVTSTSMETSNLTVLNTMFVSLTSTMLRTRVQVHHVRKTFYVDVPSQTDFMLNYPGSFTGHQSNVQVFRGRSQLFYISPTIKGYDLDVTFDMPAQMTEYTVTLTTPAIFGDIVDIVVWPQITQNSPEEQGIVFQSVNVNDSYWLQQGRTIPVRSSVPVYVLGNVGIGTTTPKKKLDVRGDVQVTGNINFTGSLYNNGVIYASGTGGGGGTSGSGGTSGPTSVFDDTQVVRHAFGGLEITATGNYFVGARITWENEAITEVARAHLSGKCSISGTDSENAYRKFETIVDCKNDGMNSKPRGIANAEANNFYTPAFSGLTHEIVRADINAIDVQFKWSSTLQPYVTSALFELIAPMSLGVISYSNISGAF